MSIGVDDVLLVIEWFVFGETGGRGAVKVEASEFDRRDLRS